MNYSEKERGIIAADSFRELSYREKKLLLASENPDNDDRQKYADALIKMKGAGVYNKIRESFLDGGYRDEVIYGLERRNLQCVTIKSADYPLQLKQISAPPLILYARGNRALLSDRLFGVVGSRKILPQAYAEAVRVCSELSEKLTLVTGVADGGDSSAISGAIEKGRVISVLPAGHDAPCSANLGLLRRVEESGLTVSEYLPESKTTRYTFTLRNRIIAALSDGVLVVSAGEDSGALSTANYAADYSKDVFAFPYSVGVPSGVGCNKLIKNGAFLCDCAEDIFSVLGIESSKPAASDKLPDGLDETEKAVVKALREQGELHAEMLAEAVNMNVAELVTVCAMLEIKGLIVRTGGNSFTAV